MSTFDIDYTLGIFPILFKYIDITISMAVISAAIALIIAVLIAVITTYKIKILTQLCDLYISFLEDSFIGTTLFIIFWSSSNSSNLFKLRCLYSFYCWFSPALFSLYGRIN